MSQSNATYKSVPIILTRATAEDFDVLYTSKGVIAAADEAGWSTVFISNEPRNHSFNDFIGEQAQEVRFQRDSLHGSPMDNLLIPLLHETLEKHKGERLFMVIHTYGSHPTYSERYTREEAYFKPDLAVKPTAENRKIITNAYDNSIRMTDGILSAFIAELDSTGCPAAMLYISDHGEDLYDDARKMYMHASPYPSYYQLHVPLICWTSDSYNALHEDRVGMMASRQQDPLQSDCVYPTLLSLMGIKCNYGQTHLSLADANYKKKTQRTYLNDHNEMMRLEDVIEPIDIEVMKQKGMYVQE
jgi:glucan phosphoethanolaminetransferase (alkaline phosphatase superfamily)